MPHGFKLLGSDLVAVKRFDEMRLIARVSEILC